MSTVTGPAAPRHQLRQSTRTPAWGWALRAESAIGAVEAGGGVFPAPTVRSTANGVPSLPTNVTMARPDNVHGVDPVFVRTIPPTAESALSRNPKVARTSEYVRPQLCRPVDGVGYAPPAPHALNPGRPFVIAVPSSRRTRSPLTNKKLSSQ